MFHMCGLYEGPIRWTEGASNRGQVSIYATCCENSVNAKFAGSSFPEAG
jgi:hypothetical protein